MSRHPSDNSRRRAIGRLAGSLAAAGTLTASSAVERKSEASQGDGTTGSMAGRPFERRSRVRVGVIGCGVRGIELLANTLPIPSVDVIAVCDSIGSRAERAAAIAEKSGRPRPTVIGGSEVAWEKLTEREPDLVLVATPWDWHVPMALHLMRAGAHVGLEIPASTTLDGCLALVRESERSRRHCILLENVCYGQEELMVLNMVRGGALGKVVHVEGAYIHDLRAQLAELPPNEGRGAWRRRAHRERIGDLYPTHGLGPLASYLGINRGDRIKSIVSVSSREAGLSTFISKNAPPKAAIRAEQFNCGDVTTSMLRTHAGVSIMLQHCVVGPRPYTRHNLVQGTRGCYIGFPPRYYVDDPNSAAHPVWRDAKELERKYEHPLWSKEGDTARALGGHGGMDYIMMFRLIDAITAGRPPDIDVYDAAAWSAVSPLSAESIRLGASVPIPDFTNGAWESKRAGFLT